MKQDKKKGYRKELFELNIKGHRGELRDRYKSNNLDKLFEKVRKKYF